PVARVFVEQGDTGTTVNQGGASGSTGIQKGGKALQSAAAEARFQLLEMASLRLGVPPAGLEVEDGVISVIGDRARNVAYADLIGGRYFDTQLEWNEQLGNNLYVQGRGTIKPTSQHKVIGTSPLRRDVPPKVLGTI